MSNIWNPYAFGVTGQPVGPQVNTLRVYGAEPSKEQLAMAQQTFAKFCMTDRLSFAPNQTQQGFLPDGSKYRIVVVGAMTTMTMWAESGTTSTEVLSGILFSEYKDGVVYRHWVLVNDGEVDSPSATWRLVALPPEYDLSMFTGRSGGTPPYNSSAWLEVAYPLPGDARYIYMSNTPIGQYGRDVAHLSNDNYSVFGATSENHLLAMAYMRGEKTLYVARSAKKFGGVVFAGMEDMAGGPLPIVQFEDSKAIFTASGDMAVERITASRNGKHIAFLLHDWKYMSSQGITGNATIEVKFPYPIIAMVSYAGVIAGQPYADMMFEAYDYSSVKLLRSDRSSDTFGPATVVDQLPDDYIDPPTEVTGYRREGRVVHAKVVGSVRVSGYTYPSNYNAHGFGGGPVRYRATRNEHTYSEWGLNYVGADKLVWLVHESKLNFSEELTGETSTSPSGNGAFGSRVRSSSTKDTSTSIEEAINLCDGDRLVLKKSEYVGHATSTGDLDIFYGLEVRSVNRYGGSLSYTLSREQRKLFVYDPSLDLLCYSEIKFTTSWSGSYDRETHDYYGDNATVHVRSTTSPGPQYPAGISATIVIKCRGRETLIDLPFPDLSQFEEVVRRHFYWSFFPNVGVAAGVGANAGIFTGNGFGADILPSVRPFYHKSGDFTYTGSFAFDGLVPDIKLTDVHAVFRKTPETGGGFLDLTVDNYFGVNLNKRYLIDSSGLREADKVVKGLPPVTRSGRTF